MVRLSARRLLWLRLTFLRIAFFTIALATAADVIQLPHTHTNTHSHSGIEQLCARATLTYRQFLQLRDVFLADIRFSHTLQLTSCIRLLPDDPFCFQFLLQPTKHILPDYARPMCIFVYRRLIAMLSPSAPHISHYHVVLARLLVPNHTHLIDNSMPFCTIVHRPVAPGAARRGHQPTTDQQHLSTRDDGWRPVPGRQRVVVRGIGQDLKRKKKLT